MKLNRNTVCVLIAVLVLLFASLACDGEGWDVKEEVQTSVETVTNDVTTFVNSSDCAPNCVPDQAAPGGGLVTDPNNLPSQVWDAVVNSTP